ncbi:MAG: hypothetical protein HY876_02505 [Coriobacteriales bacterium]|nr:hypothetical protein [Coriobacteriales bacterium]
MSIDRPPASAEETAVWGLGCERKAVAAVHAGDWRGIHDWTKSWVSRGGGAWIPDTWLLYAASALLKGQPRIAVRSLDLGIGTWLDGVGDRAALTWIRGSIIWRRLDDPKSALLDLEADLPFPRWTRSATDVDQVLDACRQAASTSRKRAATVPPRPSFTGAGSTGEVVAPSLGDRRDGDEPRVWTEVAALLSP